MDPHVEVRPAREQVDDLLDEIRKRIDAGERVLVTTLTKKMAEDLTDYFQDVGVRVRYIHSDVETIERVEIIRALRRGDFDVLVGINLLREGLDIPEVSLVAILDADKEGYLRSSRSLIQTIGRAARHVNGRVIMYADTVTDSMARALRETERRRDLQRAYNDANDITPVSIQKAIGSPLVEVYEADYATVPITPDGDGAPFDREDAPRLLHELRQAMREAAEALEFERAAEIRDRMRAIEERLGESRGGAAGSSRAARGMTDRSRGGRTARAGRRAGP
jgi:excinuclease ABC subunit B